MNTRITATLVAILWGILLVSPASGQGTAFTYQGHLNQGGVPAEGLYDFRLTVLDAATNGSVVGGPITNTAVAVSNGVFTLTMDFGGGVFTGPDRWLRIGVRTNGLGGFNTLEPRQQLTPTPYAIFAGGANAAGITGPIPGGNLSGSYGNMVDFSNAGNVFNGTFSGSGAGLSNVWQTTGNAGTVAGLNFLGTTDNQPLELDAAGARGLRLEYVSRSAGIPLLAFTDAMNVLGGYWGNTISNDVLGATIAGGGNLFFSRIPGFPHPNVVLGDFGSIGGGYDNTAGLEATIPGGQNNVATGAGSFAAGRHAQTANAGNFVWSDGSQHPFNGTAANCFDVLASGGLYFYNGSAGVNIDYQNGNNGDINYSLRFGSGSGEGIGSKRTAGGNQYGLDFYTGFGNRMSIANNGYLGIGTTSPQQQLEVNGEFLLVDGYGGEQAYLGGDGFGGDVQLGSLNPSVTAVACYNASSGNYMHLYCSSITIEGGADLAEPFQITVLEKEPPQGAVMVIDADNPGRLKMSERAYDTRVAGVLSGAQGLNPGIQMQQHGLLEGGKNVALTGRVYALADASAGAIRPGDLLTTSSLPGHAMRVDDHARAQGAILGKAMTGLKQGQGMVLVLVTLQ